MNFNFFKDHLSSIWTSFNYCINIQIGLARAKLFNFQKGVEALIIDKNLVSLTMIISFFWFVIGLVDRGLVFNYRKQIVYYRITMALRNQTFERLDHLSKIEENKMDGFQKPIRYFF